MRNKHCFQCKYHFKSVWVDHLPVVNSCPASCAGSHTNGEHREEEEKASHAETDFIYGRIAHQGTAVLPRIEPMTHFCVERNLRKAQNNTGIKLHFEQQNRCSRLRARLKLNRIRSVYTPIHTGSRKINLYTHTLNTKRKNIVFNQRLIMFLIQVKSPRIYFFNNKPNKEKRFLFK